MFDKTLPLKLYEQHSESLDAEIQIKEISTVIESLKINKAPGLGGLVPECYRKFKANLLPHLKKLFSSCLQNVYIPSSWKGANLILLPKSDQDLSFPKLHRPIFLFNTDCKLLVMDLVNRLNQFISQYISSDQAEFIPKQQLGNNIRKLSNIIRHAHEKKFSLLLYLIDAEKAFNGMNWNMKKVLKRMDFGPGFFCHG